MMTMALFVLKSGCPDFSLTTLKESFVDEQNEPMFESFTYVGSIKEINDVKKTCDWYAVLYDNEYCSQGLALSLPIYFNMDTKNVKRKPIDYLIIHKKTKKIKVFKSPRFFRSHVTLCEDSLMPLNPENLRFEAPLDGWVLEQ